MMTLEPAEEVVGVDSKFRWELPIAGSPQGNRAIRSVWYIALPLTSAHRGGHSGGGALIEGVGGQERYLNEGTVYPHASLVEMITYQQAFLPDLKWQYLDMSHRQWPEVMSLIDSDPPDVAALTVYSATALWAFIVAAAIKRANPRAVIIFGNDHAGILHREILNGEYGHRLVDFVSTGNNGPYTMMGLLYALQGQLDISRVPSVAYRHGGRIVNQAAPTFPLSKRMLPDYKLIEDQLAEYYDQAFSIWYSQHYELKRMITLPLDSGCTWGSRASRRCKHCSIQGLTPKWTDVAKAVPVLEAAVGSLGANVYAAGDSTFGFSSDQWGGNSSYLNELASACASSPVLRDHRFMLAYGLVYEFLQSAELCRPFIRTWNVGLEAFNPKLLKNDSKGINKDSDRVYEALELAQKLDYKLYVSGIVGLPGTDIAMLNSEVENWLTLAETYQDVITTISVSAPAVIPGSRMYWELYNDSSDVRGVHGEILPSRWLTETYIERNTAVRLADVEAAVHDIARGVITLGNQGGGMKFGGYMFGGSDAEETAERRLLDRICTQLEDCRDPRTAGFFS